LKSGRTWRPTLGAAIRDSSIGIRGYVLFSRTDQCAGAVRIRVFVDSDWDFQIPDPGPDTDIDFKRL